MRTTTQERILSIAEGAVMVALAVVLDLLPLPLAAGRFNFCGGDSGNFLFLPPRAALGSLAGAGLVADPAHYRSVVHAARKTIGAVILCVLLDYILAFTVIGTAPFFARLAGKLKLVGYSVGAVLVSLLRFLCSFLSGGLLWGSYARPRG